MTTRFVFVVGLAFLCSAFAQNPNVSIETDAGTFVGFRQTVDTGSGTVQLDKFLGIPFAEPPVGNLRFRKPVAKARLEDPYVAHTFGPGCIQADVFMNGDPTAEDCLFLNVFAPARSSTTDKLAVFVWIYGGAFAFGSSSYYEADLLAAGGDIIVVTFNYRLFALGFLNVPDTDTDGNVGLWDQRLAIQWVNNNIGKFGGDVNRVTIAGESAGAASVMFQAIYADNAELFHRIIAQSGTAIVSWAYTEHPVEEAKDFAAIVNCPTDDVQKMVTCLRELSVDVYKQKGLEVVFSTFPIPFVPSFDNEFVTVSPYDLFNQELDVGREARSTFASFDFLTGITTSEGGSLFGPAVGITGDVNTFMPNKSEFDNVLVPTYINVTFGRDGYKVPVEYVQAEYTPWHNPADPRAIRDELVRMYTDGLYMAPMYRGLDLHAQSSNKNTYMYRFTAVPSTHTFPAASWLNTSLHGDDLLYVFGEVADFSKMGYFGQFQEWEKTLARDFIKLWAHFVKTGNMSEPNESGLDWKPYTTEQQHYLEIVSNLTESTMRQRLQGKGANLWNVLLPMNINKYVVQEKCEDEEDMTSYAHTYAHTRLSVLSSVIAFVLCFFMK